MATFNLLLLSLSLALVLLAACGIYLARGEASQTKTRIGRWLFTLCFLGLGVIAIVSALTYADALAPLGVLSGLLIAGMSWDAPVTPQQEPETSM